MKCNPSCTDLDCIHRGAATDIDCPYVDDNAVSTASTELSGIIMKQVNKAMDYEKAYKEALGRAKLLIDEEDLTEGSCPNRNACEAIFPELAESEDERIRRCICLALTDVNEQRFTDFGVTLKDCLAYLEKQKELDMLNSTELIQAWETEKRMLEEKDFREDEWRLAQNAYMDGFALGCAMKMEKQKEQEHICDSAQYEEWFKTGLEIGLRKQKEQKPIEKQDYSGLTDFERAIHRGFLCAGVENVSRTIIEETAKECLAHIEQRPIEWSEEDGKALKRAIDCVRSWEIDYCDGDNKISERLKSLPERFNLQPKQEWSKEDEKMMNEIITIMDGGKVTSGTYLFEYAAWLKSLPERFNLQPKQEWNEKDEKIIDRILFSLQKDIMAHINSGCSTYELQNCVKWLKSIRSQLHWKPSKEQMSSLAWWKSYSENLSSLYNDLKALQ